MTKTGSFSYHCPISHTVSLSIFNLGTAQNNNNFDISYIYFNPVTIMVTKCAVLYNFFRPH